ncbi:TPA: hypothetical protein ACXEV6_003956 [Serratia marcescens]
MNIRLFSYLNNELQGIWIDKEDGVVSIIVKTSVPIIKSLWSGAPIKLAIGRITEKQVLVLGLIIEDNAENPYIIAYPPREESEIYGLNSLLLGDYRCIQITLFDSHTLRVMDMKVVLNDVGIKDEINLSQSNWFNLTSGFREGTEVLDMFYKNIMIEDKISKEQKIIKLPLTVMDKKTYLSNVYEPNGTVLSYDLSVSENGSEGYDQEALIYHSLRHVFSGEEVVRSPNIIEGNKEREFVDILVMENDCILSIQSKASSLIEMGLKSYSKLCSMYRKKALQGIDQVKGIIPILKNDVIIKDGDVLINLERSENIFHLVVISDLVLNNDGENEVFAEVETLKLNKSARVLVMSIEGLINFIKISRLNKKLFWRALEKKYNFSINNRKILINDIDSSQEHNLPFISTEQYISLLRGDR